MEEGRMTFASHLRELRTVLIQSALSIIVMFFVISYYRDFAFDILLYPHLTAVKMLNEQSSDLRIEKPELIAYSYEGPLITFLKTSIYGSLFFSLPVILFLFWNFLKKGLYPNERWKIMLFGTMSFFMFIAGVAAGFLIFLPYLLYFLTIYSFPDKIGATYSFSSYLDLVILLTIVVGIIFQIPIVMAFIANVGWMTWRSFVKYWRHYIVVIFILSAVLTPTTDVVSMLLLAVPMVLLYFLGIFLAFALGKKA
ncbi:MAG: twin-arginine translocase subunit TatC [Planctomycetes bacterium]|nr:twin-arginine translocase subunit TatC [Planctomycetota bacterium]